MWGSIAKQFVENKRLGIITILALFVWGVIGFALMPKQYNPQITAPAFVVETRFPGASAEETHRLISVPMEDAVADIPRVDNIFSESREGVSLVTVQFEIGDDVESAKITLRQKIQGNIDRKPIGSEDPIIRDIDPETVPLVVLALTSREYSLESIRALAYDVKDELKKIPQTGEVSVVGGYTQNLIIDLDIGALEAYQMTPSDVSRALRNINGALYSEEFSSENGRFPIRVSGAFHSIDEVEQLMLTMREGASVRLKDVARVSFGPGEVKEFRLFTTKETSNDAVFLLIPKQKGSNGTEVARQVNAHIESLKESGTIPSAVEVQSIRDEGRVASESVSTLSTNLLQSIMIVSIVLWAFLGFRSATIVAISIPLSLAFVFALGHLFGYTINRITLFALILSLGLLVDSAIVVVENMMRHLKEYPNTKPSEAIASAIQEVGTGLFLSTLTTILAFVPMAFVTGMMGPYMGPIPFFVPVALIGSFLIAITVSPYLVSRLRQKPTTHNPQVVTRESFFLRVMHSLRDRYAHFLGEVLLKKSRRRGIVWVTFGLFFLAILLPAFGIVPFRMLPKADKEQFFVYLNLPETEPVETTRTVTQKAERFFLESSDVTSVVSFVGTPQIVDFNGLFKGSENRSAQHQATLQVNLSHPNDRERTSEELVLGFRQALEVRLEEYPGVRFIMVEDPPGPPVRSTIFVKVLGKDSAVLDAMARDISHMMGDIDEVKDIDTSVEHRGYEKAYRIDIERAQALGVSSQEILETLQTGISGSIVGLYHPRVEENVRILERQYIVVRLDEQDRRDYETIDRLWVRSEDGSTVAIKPLLQEVEAEAMKTLLSDERERAEYVSAEMGNRSVVYASIDMLKELLNYQLPSGAGEVVGWSLAGVTYRDTQTGEEYQVLLDGEWKLTLDVFRDLGIAFGVALLAIFFVLAIQFESLRVALLVMVTIPLGLIGVLPGFAVLYWTQGIYFNATSMIGVIALAGIVVNNAIILLEHLRHILANEPSLRHALVATGRTRFVPILLTSLTTILGSLTIMSDPVWEGLAWAIFWGLSLSSILTLIVFPVLYYEVMKSPTNTPQPTTHNNTQLTTNDSQHTAHSG